jgi:elongation factor G
VGHLAYLRVYSGQTKTGDAILNVRRDKKSRVGRLLQMHANKRQEVESASAGEIVAAVGLKDVATGDTLCDPRHAIALESLQIPEPVLSIAIEPKTQVDMDRLADSLDRLVHEDPSFRVTTDSETGQTLISGMGELHLEVICDRLFREFKVGANVGPPQVSYKETIRRRVRAEGRYIKQTGGSGDFAVVVVEIEPAKPGLGYSFEDRTKGGSVPKEFVSAVGSGCQEALQNGELLGVPVVDVAVRLMDGRAHEVDSSERSFKIAGSMAIKEGLRKADSVLLEPLMDVEVVTPEEFVGAVQGDLNGRRGRLTGLEVRAGAQVIDAEVPLATMFGYVNNLRSMTQGRATYTMQFSKYAEVPDKVSAGLVYR